MERTFGISKQCFPILRNCVRVALEKVPKLMVTFAMLHNVAIHLNDLFDYNPEFDEETGALVVDIEE